MTIKKADIGAAIVTALFFIGWGFMLANFIEGILHVIGDDAGWMRFGFALSTGLVISIAFAVLVHWLIKDEL